jgi:hypothetical protein
MPQIPDRNGDDLAEGERDDGEIIAAQTQGGRPDDDAEESAYRDADP